MGEATRPSKDTRSCGTFIAMEKRLFIYLFFFTKEVIEGVDEG